MSDTISELHTSLRGIKTFSEDIDLFDRINLIKESAKNEWLFDIEKNGYEHSKRLEEYLDSLTRALRDDNEITPDEIFILLCAAYMHDIGYRCEDGSIRSEGHPQRSRDMILADPAKYHFGDFPIFDGKCPRVAEAVGAVCAGHASNVPLESIDDDFVDQVFKTKFLDLRKLTALLRMSDEADDPYIRSDPSRKSIRKKIPLVEIRKENIVWHWNRSREEDPFVFQRLIEEKKSLLESSVKYLSTIGAGRWYLVLDPQVTFRTPFMAAKPVETFVGRQNDLETLHEKIQRRGEGAVTGVAGTGGIGKTELAKLYAERHKRDYPGGIFWASLKGSTWKDEAVKIIAAASPTGKTSVSFADDQNAIEYITKNVLTREDALLIIDNVEEGDEIIKSRCAVLVTTRNKGAFGAVPGDAIHELPGLPVDDGLELLTKYLGPQRIERDRDGALRLVHLFGGMPLAIEIAAKHLREVPHLSFPDYIGRIQNKIQELKIEGDPDKNVLSTLELSLEQLENIAHGEELRSLFEGASVCAMSGFTSRTLVKTAGFDTGQNSEVEDLVARLNTRSLLEFDVDANRYSMHPMLRQIAEKRLHENPEKEKEFKRNHCNVFLHYCEAHDDDPDSLINEKDGIWQALIQSGQIDDTAKVRHRLLEYMSKPYLDLIEIGRFNEAFSYLVDTNLINIGYIGEVRTLISLLTPLEQNRSKLGLASQSWLLNTMGLASVNLSEYRKAIQLYGEALKIAQHISSVGWEGIIFGNMGVAYENLGEYQTAIKLYERALKIARYIGNVSWEGLVLSNMGVTYTSLGEYQKAIELHEDALKIKRRIGDSRGEESALGSIGVVYMGLCNYRMAIKYYEEALKIARHIGDAQGEENALGNMGLAYANLGNNRKATQLYEEARMIARRIGDTRGEGNALGNIGLIYADQGEYQKAIEYYMDQLNIVQRIGDVCGEENALGSMGLAYANLGQYQKAIDLYERALVIAQRIGDVRGEGNTLGNMGLVFAKLGDHQKAIRLYNDQLEIVRRIGNTRGEGAAIANIGLAYADLGKNTKACQYINEAKQIFGKLGLDHEVSNLEEIEKIMGCNAE